MLTFLSSPPAVPELPEVCPGEGLAPRRELRLWLLPPLAPRLLELLREPPDDWLLDLFCRRMGVTGAGVASGSSPSVPLAALEEGLPGCQRSSRSLSFFILLLAAATFS